MSHIVLEEHSSPIGCILSREAMRSVYRGTLTDTREPEQDLSVSLVLEDAWMDILTSDRTLGRWPLDQVSAERRLANRFTLAVAGEEWDFACEDPAAFAVDGIDHIATYNRPRRTDSITRLKNNIGTLGRWALASAVTIFGFGVGMTMGRYRLDGANIYTAAALLGLLALNLMLIRIISDSGPKDTVPSPLESKAQDRTPLRVDAVATPRSADVRARRRELAEGELVVGLDPSELSMDEAPEFQTAARPATDWLPADQIPAPGPGEDDDRSVEADQGTDSPAGPPPTEMEHEERASDAARPAVPISIEIRDLSEADLDLASIYGIGPVFAEWLNDHGVENVLSLALLDDEGIERIVEALGRFGKRLYSADWVGQARRRVGLIPSQPEAHAASVGEPGLGDGATP